MRHQKLVRANKGATLAYQNAVSCNSHKLKSPQIGPFEFKVEGRSKTAGTAEGCDFWDQNGVLLLHLRVQQQRKSKINELTMSDGIE